MIFVSIVLGDKLSRGLSLLVLATLVVSSVAQGQQQCTGGGCSSTSGTQSSSSAAASPATLNNLALYRSYVVNGDYVVSGVGVRGSGNGSIIINTVPPGAHVVTAYLYWETLGNGQFGVFNGHSIAGVSLGTVSSPCWNIPLITVYRADVTALIPSAGNGVYTVQFPDSGDFNIAPSTEGASLVIIYQATGLSLTSISIYDGSYTLRSESPTFSLTIPSAGSLSTPIGRMTHIVGDGQPWADTLQVNGTVLGTPSNAFAGALGQMWDNLTFDISSLVGSPGTPITTTVNWSVPNSTGSFDCLTWGAVIYSSVLSIPTSLDSVDPITTNNGNLLLPTPNLNQLTQTTNVRVGVAADGVTKLVARFATSFSGAATFSITDQNGLALNNASDYGSLTTLQGGSPASIVTVQANPLGNGQFMALVVYTAPANFVRSTPQNTDTSLAERQVFLTVQFSPDTGPPVSSPLPLSLLIIRPPVVLVHGIWADYTTWDYWNANVLPSDRTCTDSGRFYACRVNYKFANDQHFSVSAPFVGSQIRGFINKFKATKNVAAVQASVIAHSMGGDLVRILPLCGTTQLSNCNFTYRTDLNFNAGDVYRLITIGTPHRGSSLADRLIAYENTVCGGILGWATGHGTLASNFADQGHRIDQGAVEDLQDTSTVIATLSAAPLAFPLHFAVGVASSTDESLADQSAAKPPSTDPGGLVAKVDMCNSDIIPNQDLRAVFGTDSDLIVSVGSQRNNLAAGTSGTTTSTSVAGVGNLIHSSAIVVPGQTGFSSQELNSAQFGQQLLLILDNGPFVH